MFRTVKVIPLFGNLILPMFANEPHPFDGLEKLLYNLGTPAVVHGTKLL